MPIYRYKCKTCGLEFEDIIKMSERDKFVGTGCGNCAGGSLIRIPTSGSFKINGYSEENNYSTPSSTRK